MTDRKHHASTQGDSRDSELNFTSLVGVNRDTKDVFTSPVGDNRGQWVKDDIAPHIRTLIM